MNKKFMLNVGLLFVALISSVVNAGGINLIAGGLDEMRFVGEGEVKDGSYLSIECVKLECSLTRRNVKNAKGKVWSYGDASEPLDGYVVKIKNGSKSVALVSGLTGVHEGKVKTWFYRGDKRTYKDNGVSILGAKFSIKDNSGGLDLYLVRENEGSKLSKKHNCMTGVNIWMLKARGRVGAIYNDCKENEDDPLGHQMRTDLSILRWVGDIDGDGLPDLIISAMDASVDLYLSSDNMDGKNWLPSATMNYSDPMESGC